MKKPEIIRCSKTEAGNALRNAATPREFGGTPQVQFGVVGTKETAWQPLNQAILNVTTAKEVAWSPHPSGYDLVLVLSNRGIRYNVPCPAKRKHAN